MTFAIIVASLVVLVLGSLYLTLRLIEVSKPEKEGWEIQIENLESQAKKLREQSVDLYSSEDIKEYLKQANALTDKAISLRKDFDPNYLDSDLPDTGGPISRKK